MKITLPELVARVAIQSGQQKKTSEDFLKALFNTIAAKLEEGETVKVAGLGTFKLITIESRKSVNVNTGQEFEIPAHRRVSFVPVKELAAKVNAPFEAFQAVELRDDVNVEDEVEVEMEIPEEKPIEEPAAEEPVVEEPAEEVPVIEEPVVEEPVVEEPVVEEPMVEEPVAEEPAEEVPVIEEPVQVEETVAEEPVEEAVDQPFVENKRSGFGTGLIIGLLITLGLILLAIGAWSFLSSKGYRFVKEVDSTIIVVKETVRIGAETENDTIVTQETAIENQQPEAREPEAPATKPTEEVEAPVYDRISKTRYLTTMAKEHYGNYNLWPYIYKENEKILGHPDRIKPGTRVVIPKLSKYGVNPNSPEDIAKAKKLGVEIYSRYK